MQELIKQVKEAGAIGSDEAIAIYLKELRYSSPVGEQEAKELAEDFNQQQQKAIAPSSSGKAIAPSTQKALTKRGTKRSAREAVAETIASRDTAVAEILDDAKAIAEQKTSARKKQIAEDLGSRMAEAELQAIEEVTDFLQMTLGSSKWLLQGAEEILEAELIN